MNNETVERLKTDLLAIIKEGKNLPEGEYTELRDGIRVNKNRVREFERLCDNYYEMVFNQVVENNTDTITPVYNELENLIKSEEEEYNISKAAEFSLTVKDEVERFKALTKSFNTVDNTYKLTIRNLNDLYLKRENTKEWQDKVDELNSEAKRLTENSTIITNEILKARTKINEALIEYAEEQMGNLRKDYENTLSGVLRETTEDNSFVLPGKSLEYNSLYRLSLILKHANTIDNFEDLVSVNDAMIVTKDQKEVLESTVLNNIKLFEYLKKSDKRGNMPKDVNLDVINRIKESLELLGEKAKDNKIPGWDAKEENDRLLDIMQILQKANKSDLALVPVWDSMYVLYEDQNKLIKLLNESKILNKLNPEHKQKEQNEKLIKELYAYLDELANKVTAYNGVSNLPIKQTKSIGDKTWIVNKKDCAEANRIIEIIKMLERQSGKLIPVWGIANINPKDISKFKEYVNETLHFAKSVPSIPLNEKEMDAIREELKSLIIKAKENKNNEKMCKNGLVLESDYPLYKLLEEKYKYLDQAKASDNLVDIDSVKIDSDFASKYHEVSEKIKNYKVENVRGASTTIETPNQEEKYDFTANTKEIEKLEARRKELTTKLGSLNDTEYKELAIIGEIVSILKDAINIKELDKLEEINGFIINIDDKNRYLELLEILNNINTRAEENSQGEILPVGRVSEPSLAERKKGAIDVEPNQDNTLDNTLNEVDLSANEVEIIRLTSIKEELLAKEELTPEEANEIELLQKQINILSDAYLVNELQEVNGVFVPVNYKEEYINNLAELAKLEEIRKNDNASQLDFTKNLKEIERLEALRKELLAKKELTAIEKETIEELEFQINLLKDGCTAKDKDEINGLYILAGSKEEYVKSMLKLAELQEKLAKVAAEVSEDKSKKEGKIKKLVKGFRTLKTKAALFVQNNFNNIVAIGLGIGALAYAASTGDMSIASSLARIGTAGLSSAGIITGVKNILNKGYENRLPDVQPVVPVEVGLKDDFTISENKDYTKSYGFGPITQTKLVNAKIDAYAHRENLTDEGKTEEEILQELGMTPEEIKATQAVEISKDEAPKEQAPSDDALEPIKVDLPSGESNEGLEKKIKSLAELKETWARSKQEIKESLEKHKEEKKEETPKKAKDSLLDKMREQAKASLDEQEELDKDTPMDAEVKPLDTVKTERVRDLLDGKFSTGRTSEALNTMINKGAVEEVKPEDVVFGPVNGEVAEPEPTSSRTVSGPMSQEEIERMLAGMPSIPQDFKVAPAPMPVPEPELLDISADDVMEIELSDLDKRNINDAKQKMAECERYLAMDPKGVSAPRYQEMIVNYQAEINNIMERAKKKGIGR